jgi:uncharacterized protein (TIGR03067 family)
VSRRTPAAALGIALLFPAVLLPAEDRPAAQDRALEGMWAAVSFIHEGKEEPQAPGKILLTFRGSAMTLEVGGTTLRATVRADAGKTPQEIDMTYENGPDKGKTIRGVYEVKGDTLRICHGDATKPRPAGIASKQGSGYNVGNWKRVRK